MKRSPSPILTLAAALATMLFCSTAFAGGVQQQHTAQDTLDVNRKLWNEVGLTRYTFRFRQLCFCPETVTARVVLDVVNDRIVAAYDPETGDPVAIQATHRTLEDLFDLIQRAIDTHADTVDVSYDKDLGFPTAIFIDQSEMMADEELWFEVSGLKPLVGSLP